MHLVARHPAPLLLEKMWGGTIFFVTMVLVIPSARVMLEEYAALAMARLAAQSPLSEIILVSIAVIAVMLLLILRQGTAERAPVYRVRREIRGRSAADLEKHLPQEIRIISWEFVPAGKLRFSRRCAGRYWYHSTGRRAGF